MGKEETDNDLKAKKEDNIEETKTKTEDPDQVTKVDEVEAKSADLDLPKDVKAPAETPAVSASTPQAQAVPPLPLKPVKPLNKTARMIEVEEYLVKFKNFSYLHCQWLTEEELHRGDKRISQKIKRFKQKREKSANVLDFCEDEHFNPDYVEVDRVLDASIHTDEDTGVVTKHFLVKWRSLPYEDCTWELI